MLNSIVALLESGAGGAGGSYESIATVTSSGGVSTLSFTSIPSTYVALQIRGGNLQSENGTTGTYGWNIYFNSDTGSNYASHSISGNTSAASASGATAQTSILIGRYTRNSETAKGVGIVDIHNYASTTQNKTVRGFSGAEVNSGSSFVYAGTSGLWLSTSAITSITLTGNGNWKTGSTFALYGIKGA